MQVAFLRDLQRLLTYGQFVASYKFALLHALADLAVLKGNDDNQPLALTTYEIAEQFVRLYWSHARPFVKAGVLRQNTGKPAAVLSHLISAHGASGGTLSAFQNDAAAWHKTVKVVESVVKVQALWKLQTVGHEHLDFLYPNVGEGSAITLRPGVAYCLRAFHGLVIELVRAAWLRYVRRVNADALGDSADLSAFLFGAERADLSAYREILLEVDGSRCFYCEGRLGKTIDVDHFVPWSRYPVDLGHNFVLAHRRCNNAKSDHLAAEPHLAHWKTRNKNVGDTLARAFTSRRILHDLEASLRIAGWAYAHAQADQATLWLKGTELLSKCALLANSTTRHVMNRERM